MQVPRQQSTVDCCLAGKTCTSTRYVICTRSVCRNTQITPAVRREVNGSALSGSLVLEHQASNIISSAWAHGRPPLIMCLWSLPNSVSVSLRTCSWCMCTNPPTTSRVRKLHPSSIRDDNKTDQSTFPEPNTNLIARRCYSALARHPPVAGTQFLVQQQRGAALLDMDLRGRPRDVHQGQRSFIAGSLKAAGDKMSACIAALRQCEREPEKYPAREVAIVCLAMTVNCYNLVSLLPYVGFMVQGILGLATTNEVGAYVFASSRGTMLQETWL